MSIHGNCTPQQVPPFTELLRGLDTKSPEAVEARNHLPADVRAVIADFDKDYLIAVDNFKNAFASLLEWAMRARDELQACVSYLETEKLRGELGLNDRQPENQK